MDARPVVYVIGFSAPPVLHLAEFIVLLLDEGWDPWVVLSPTAASWTNVDLLSRASGHRVRIDPRTPSDRDPLPVASAVVAAPLTFNSLNKWAAGIGDTFALGLLNEALGLGIPVCAALCVKEELRRHPAYARSQRILSGAGVAILQPENVVVGSPAGVNLDWAAAKPPDRTQRRESDTP